MLFTSLHWCAFLAFTFVAFNVVPARARRWLMLAASIYFYASWSAPHLALIFGQICVDWTCGQLLGRTEATPRRRAIVAASVVINLGTLCLFKYYGLFASTLAPLGLRLPAVDLVLPLAISFYTFESMSYTIDVYRRALAPVRSPLHLALFITWFPHLIAGPIIRPAELVPQLDSISPATRARFVSGLNLMAVGYAKKLLGADWLARVVDPSFAEPASRTSLELLIAVYAYAFQIYLDFSAYTDIARGVSRWFGIELPENFDAPYLSASITEFWRRWHKSLSHWLRDYLYISLGGNRSSEARTYVNLMLTMLLGGLWHGASWTFLAWGGIHGGLLAIERALGVKSVTTATGWRLWLRRAATFHAVCVAWVLFRATTFGGAMDVFKGIAARKFWLSTGLVMPSLGALAIIAAYWALRGLRPRVLRLAPEGPAALGLYSACLGAFIVALMVLGASSNAFIYFQF
jgi:alginate O-acetyltransferase complex protein AlgI